MTLTKDGLGVIRLGDTTTHGGTVISVAQTIATDMGILIACVGDMVRCPKCNGTYPIVEGDPTDTIEGVPVAYHGHKTACGAVLISSIGNTTIIAGSGPQAVMGQSSPDERLQKEIVDISWSYGDSKTIISDKSRFYVDLNLHVRTKNYHPGEMVTVSIQGADEEEKTNSDIITLNAVVGTDGTATIMNVFDGKKIELYAED